MVAPSDATDAQAAAASAGPATTAADVPALMWEGAGLVRDAEGLRRTVAFVAAASRRVEPALSAASTRAAWEQASVALVAWLVARAALRREESRGGHRRADFPTRDDLHWQVHVADRRAVQDINEQEG